jgi:hypothetical protein
MRKFRRSSALGVVAATVVASGLFATPGTAAAIDGCPNYDGASHCYGIGRFGYTAGQGPVYMNAMWSQLRVYCLAVGDPSTDFVDYEMWMSTNNNNPSLSTWVESGLTDGTLYYSPGQEQGFINFWADYRPDGSYNEHYIGPASLNAYNTAAFYWVTNTNNWDVYFNSSYVGTSTNNGAFAGGGDNGIESTSPVMAIDGDTYGWSYADPSNNWHDVYNDPFVNDSGGLLTGSASGPAVHAQTTQGCTLPSATPAVSTPATSGSMADAANRVARMLGDSQPGSMSYVKTTRQKASTTASGGRVNTDQSVYLIELPGKFTTPAARVPQGKKAATGSNLTVTVDAANGQVLDWGITNTPTTLSTLGAVSALG